MLPIAHLLQRRSYGSSPSEHRRSLAVSDRTKINQLFLHQTTVAPEDENDAVLMHNIGETNLQFLRCMTTTRRVNTLVRKERKLFHLT